MSKEMSPVHHPRLKNGFWSEFNFQKLSNLPAHKKSTNVVDISKIDNLNNMPILPFTKLLFAPLPEKKLNEEKFSNRVRFT
jgi:hypothetical protein